nr:hypothetical protein [Paraburkholderia madseniana]MDQ6464992.1 hypothetical protein [Paraburkholderia madseniana]
GAAESANSAQSGYQVNSIALKPVPPPIIVSICKPVNASPMIHAAANAAQLACSAYCQTRRKDLVEAL